MGAAILPGHGVDEENGVVEKRRPELAGLPVDDRDRRCAVGGGEHHVVQAEVSVDHDQRIDQRRCGPCGGLRPGSLDQRRVLGLDPVPVRLLVGLDRRRDGAEQQLRTSGTAEPRERAQRGVVPAGGLELNELGECGLGPLRIALVGRVVSDLRNRREVFDHERRPARLSLEVAPVEARHGNAGERRDLLVEPDLALVEAHGDPDLAARRIVGRELHDD